LKPKYFSAQQLNFADFRPRNEHFECFDVLAECAKSLGAKRSKFERETASPKITSGLTRQFIRESGVADYECAANRGGKAASGVGPTSHGKREKGVIAIIDRVERARGRPVSIGGAARFLRSRRQCWIRCRR
jgi:hypothetical protein